MTGKPSSTPWQLIKYKYYSFSIWKNEFRICTVEGSENLDQETNFANAAFIVEAVNQHEALKKTNAELLKVAKLAKTQLNAIANELKSDFNLSHDNIATNACWLAGTIQDVLSKVEDK